MTTYTIQDIATALGAQAFGAVHLKISALAEPASAGPDDLALASDPRYADQLAKGHAKAALLWGDADWQALGLEAAILTPRPRYAMSGLTAMMDAGWRRDTGIHPSALIHPTATIGKGASIGALTVIGANASIGTDARIAMHVSIGEGVQIGDAATIRDGVRITHNVTIGDHVVIQPNAVIGGDGFSFVTPEPSTSENIHGTTVDTVDGQAWARIHSLGGVLIGNNVEIGALSCIDSGTIRATTIGDGTKIDNQVQIGHNVICGKNCLFCGQVGIAGSVRLGNNVVLGGKACVSDNITLGDGVVAGVGSVVMSNTPAGQMILGYPATKMAAQMDSYKALRRLPRILREFQTFKKEVTKPGGTD